jgi:ElaB/YqjD/DUF883 family membrane-anchored ribosome-binding protein
VEKHSAAKPSAPKTQRAKNPARQKHSATKHSAAHVPRRNNPNPMESLMSQSPKSNSTAANDFEAVSAQLSELRADMARLAETVGDIAGRRSSNMASDIAEGFDEAKHYVERTGKSAEHQLEESVTAHPFLTIGLAAMAGLLLGTMAKR